MRGRKLFVSAAILATVCGVGFFPAAQAAVIYVDAGAEDGNSGSLCGFAGCPVRRGRGR